MAIYTKATGRMARLRGRESFVILRAAYIMVTGRTICSMAKELSCGTSTRSNSQEISSMARSQGEEGLNSREALTMEISLMDSFMDKVNTTSPTQARSTAASSKKTNWKAKA